MNNNIGEFVQAIMKQAGIDDMPEDFRNEYVERVKIEAQKRLGIEAMKELSNDQIDEFNSLVAAGRGEANMKAYLEHNIDNFEEKMAKALQEFGQEIIESAKELNI